MITQPSGNGVEPYTVGATALPLGTAVMITAGLLVKATSALRVFGFMLEDGAVSQTQAAVAVNSAVRGKVRAITSAAITAIGSPLYVGATAGAVTPTDPGTAVIAGFAAETCNSGDLTWIYPA